MKKVCILLALLILTSFTLSACNDEAIKPGGVYISDNSIASLNQNSSAFVHEANGIDIASADFALDMLKLNLEDGKNTMISPVSILIALGMTANGAKGDTLSEMEDVLFGGESIDEYNAYYKALIERITNPAKGKLSVANSVWYRDEAGRLTMNENFINLVKDTYDSEVLPADFADIATVERINNWVKDKTENNIDKIVEKISENTVIYLINALYFEAEWETKYFKENVTEGSFMTGENAVEANYMYAEENFYIEDDNAVGFSKPYEGGEFSFVALLPNEGTTAEEYLNQLSGEKLLQLLESRENKLGTAKLPKFKSEFKASLVEPLKELGMKTAFDSNTADFKNMAISTRGNISISEVLHKTFIEVNETGTKAAAVTSVEMMEEAAPEYTFQLTFNRPFVYMIIDEETNLPLFIGIMNNPAE